jgi:hypothetical protein
MVEWGGEGGVSEVVIVEEGCGVNAFSGLIAKLSCTIPDTLFPLSPWVTRGGVTMFGGS